MEFRLVQHETPMPGSGHDLLSPRRISFASEIPRIGLHGFERELRPIRLRGVVDAGAESFVSVYGAYRQGPFWVVARRDPFPFGLGEHLPRMAQHALVPEIVAMEHPSRWSGCLENMLTRSSWSRLIADIWRSERVCYECGSVPFRPERLEGHEAWDVDMTAPYGPTKRLRAIRVLCGACLEMKHLGAAMRRKAFDPAFLRLCAINRVSSRSRQAGELAAYRREIEVRHESLAGESMDWTFDLSLLSGRTLHLRESVALREDGSLCHRGTEPGCVRITDADITVEDRCVIVRPRGWAG